MRDDGLWINYSVFESMDVEGILNRTIRHQGSEETVQLLLRESCPLLQCNGLECIYNTKLLLEWGQIRRIAATRSAKSKTSSFSYE